MTEARYLLIKALPLEVLSSTGGSVVPEGKTERRTFAGFKLVIENPVGTVRQGVDETGKPWRTEFQHAYGEIVGSLGVDGDPVDVYLGDDEAATEVYIVRQMKRKDWEKFDEDKCFLGFPSMEAAKQAYLNHYDDPRFFGGIIAMPIDEFRVKVRATKDNPTMLKTLILFTKAHIAGHTRTLKSGKVVRVNAYDNKVVGRGKPGAAGQADLFGGVQIDPEPDQAPISQAKTTKPEKDWRDEENWHSRTMGRMKTLDEASLRYVMKDATEAAENLERAGSTSKKAGQYRDEAHYASMELKSRRDAAAKKPAKASPKVQPKVKQVDTPAFKRWFGDSKVVDAEGKPLVVYHGTGADITAFDPSLAAASLSAEATGIPGFYFATSPVVANGYARKREAGGNNVMPSYVAIRHPATADYAELIGGTFDRSALEAEGFDGVKVQRGGETWAYIAFRPEQIKSAVGNNGNFDPNDPSLTKAHRIAAIRRIG